MLKGSKNSKVIENQGQSRIRAVKNQRQSKIRGCRESGAVANHGTRESAQAHRSRRMHRKPRMQKILLTRRKVVITKGRSVTKGGWSQRRARQSGILGFESTHKPWHTKGRTRTGVSTHTLNAKSFAFCPRFYPPGQNPLGLIGFLVVGPAGSPPLACIRGLPHNRYMTQCISALDIFDARGVTGPIFAAGYALALLDVAQTRWYLIIKSPLTQGGVTGPVFAAGYVLRRQIISRTSAHVCKLFQFLCF
jgi:hypothetical protein